MQIREMAQAKVNLYLRILGRRPDGYHQLETAMQTLELADEILLTARPSGIRLSCSDERLTSGPDNLAYRAAALLAGQYPGHGVEILLLKRIPWQAGLGGGSSDAAAVLRGLNRLWQLELPMPRLMELAAELGSDVPFFLIGGLAIASGRGEVVNQLNTRLDMSIALIIPPFGLSTKAVYGNWHPQLAGAAPSWHDLHRALLSGDRQLLLSLLHNDLEQPAFLLRPELATLKREIRQLGLPVLLSGSGSALFVLLFHPEDEGTLASRLPADYQLIFTRCSPLLSGSFAGNGF